MILAGKRLLSTAIPKYLNVKPGLDSRRENNIGIIVFHLKLLWQGFFRSQLALSRELPRHTGS